MSNRLAVLTVLAGVLLWSPPSAASQPEGNAGKLLSNPLVKLFAAGGPEGLPPVVCGGFNWFEPIAAPSSPSDSLTLSLALVPFRAGPTTIRLSDPTNGRRILFLGFVDGLVKGLPYDRDGWNDVQVDLRIATQDYEVTVNGLHAGPFPSMTPDARPHFRAPRSPSWRSRGISSMRTSPGLMRSP